MESLASKAMNIYTILNILPVKLPSAPHYPLVYSIKIKIFFPDVKKIDLFVTHDILE